MISETKSTTAANAQEANFRINGKHYTFGEIFLIQRFYRDCVDRRNIGHALDEALSEIEGENPDIAEFGHENFELAYEECLKHLPLWKREREDFLNEAEWAYKDLAAVAVRDMYERKGA